MDPFFKDNQFLITELIDKTYIDLATKYYDVKYNIEKSFNPGAKGDVVKPNSKILYNDTLAFSFLISLTPKVEEIVGKKLFPTYAFCRAYELGQRLVPHTDREACEYSITLPICGPPWPLQIKKDKKWNRIHLSPGDGLIYKGQEIQHKRTKLEEDGPNIQLHLHYVDVDGPHRSRRFDRKWPINEYAKSAPFFTMSRGSEHVSFSQHF